MSPLGHRPDLRNSGKIPEFVTARDVVITLAAFVVFVAILMMPTCARATWSEAYASQPPDIQSWFKQQHNSKGEWCCDESDGHPFYGDYTINQDGSVSVELNGAPHVIPAEKVLTGKNPTGHAVWWYIETGGQHRDYCFSPGTLG